MGKSRSPVAVKTRLAKSYSACSGKRIANDAIAMEYRFGDKTPPVSSVTHKQPIRLAELNCDNYKEFEEKCVRSTFSNPHSLQAELAIRRNRHTKKGGYHGYFA
jgi:hypothetical protein